MIKKFFTLLCLCTLCIGSAWGEYSTTYTSNVTLDKSAKVVISTKEYDAAKVGASKSGGSTSFTVPKNTTTIHLHIAGWNGETTVPTVSTNIGTVSSLSSIKSDSGISGSGTTYTLTGTPSNYYTTLTLSGITGEATITFTAKSGKQRFVLFGVNTEQAEGIKYTVTYDGNGATSGVVPVDNKEYEKDATVTVLDNTGNLAKIGYTYGGWNTNADGTGTNYSAGEAFNLQQNTTLYAKWDAISYDITKSTVEGGTCSVKVGGAEVATATTGTELTLSNTPDEGYKFQKYVIAYTKVDGTPGTSNITTGSYKMPASNITITPVFEQLKKFTITLNNRGTLSTLENVIQDSNLSEALRGQEPADEFNGYSFYGWSKVQKASADNLVSSSDLVTGDITLYAVYCKSEGTLSTSEVTSLSNLSAGLYILGSEKTTNTLMYMPNTESTGSNPALKSLDLNEVSVDMVWNLTSTGTANEYYIRPYGNDEIGLGVTTSTGANIRISSSYVNTMWTISESESVNWQFMSGNMYLAVYEDNAWRNYKNNTTNQNGKFHIYKVVLPKETYSLGLSYTRTVTEGNFGTICLEEDAVVAGATLYSVLGVDNQNEPTTLYLEEVETATAGVPYIFKATSTQLVASFKGNAVSVPAAEDASNGLVGSFEKAEITAGAKNYILKNNLWCYVPEGNINYVGANKAYLNLADVPVKAEAKGDYEMIFDGDVTSINLVPTTEEIGGIMYNLNGMKVNASYKGIVVKNGKKFINK